MTNSEEPDAIPINEIEENTQSPYENTKTICIVSDKLDKFFDECDKEILKISGKQEEIYKQNTYYPQKVKLKLQKNEYKIIYNSEDK